MFKRANLKRTRGLLMSTGPYGSYWVGIVKLSEADGDVATIREE